MTEEERKIALKSTTFLIGCLAGMGPEYHELREALIDLELKLTEPKVIINVSENIQQTVNVEEAKNIINNEL
jgi:hypothetical protein